MNQVPVEKIFRLKILTWNIHGLSDKLTQKKNKWQIYNSGNGGQSPGLYIIKEKKYF